MIIFGVTARKYDTRSKKSTELLGNFISPNGNFIKNKTKILIFIDFKISICISENNVQRIYTINFYVFRNFDRDISNIVNNKFLHNFSSILILFGSKKFLLIISLKKHYVRLFISISLTLLLIFIIQLLI